MRDLSTPMGVAEEIRDSCFRIAKGWDQYHEQTEATRAKSMQLKVLARVIQDDLLPLIKKAK